MRRNLGVAILAMKYEKHTPRIVGRLGEARESNNVSAKVTANDSTNRDRKAVGSRGSFASIRWWATSTSLRDAVSAMETCTCTI
jgi:hypothetical protein